MPALRLFQTAEVEEQWREVVLPWLRAEVKASWRDARPTVVLTPSRAVSFYLRARLAEEGLSFFGLRFWIPSDARTFLTAQLRPAGSACSVPEENLLARFAATMLATDSREPSLRSVQRDPASFLRAFDLLAGAGWTPSHDGPAYSRHLARRFEDLLQDAGLTTQAGLHRELRRLAANQMLIRGLLVVGFDAAHWPLWDLLQAIVASSSSATIGLLSPRRFGERVDQLWIGSWEEQAEISAELPSASAATPPRPFEIWSGAYEAGSACAAPDANFSFIATPDLRSQIQAVVLQALTHLASPACTRLGIIFPEANALALGVSEELARLQIPLDDATGFWAPGAFAGPAWSSWLALQEDPSVEKLIAWLRAADTAVATSESDQPDARELAEIIEDALAITLVDDLNFLALHLAGDEGAAEKRAAEFLRRIPLFPARGSFKEYIEIARSGWRLNGGSDSAETFPEPPAWLVDATWELDRATFLAWLRESCAAQTHQRTPEHHHFYGRVHLLLYSQMPGQTWSHLILTGLNEGRWPRLVESAAFGSRHELAELNRHAVGLNRRGTQTGGQGSGHEVVAPGHGYCLLPRERQDLALRDLCLAIEATSKAVCLAALTADRGRPQLPSDFFAVAYQSKFGVALDEVSLAALARETTAWCSANRQVQAENHSTQRLGDAEEIDRTRKAFVARRDEEKPFGPYEFSYAAPPSMPVQLPCKAWERALQFPSATWLERIVGVRAWPNGQPSWRRAMGTWVHRWLTQALVEGQESGQPASLLTYLREHAAREWAVLREEMVQSNAVLHPWWNQVWDQARGVALGLGESLIPHLEGKVVFTEYPLPHPMLVTLPGGTEADFELRGRIDLILIEASLPGQEAYGLGSSKCWVIDFKTGSDSGLTVSALQKGAGLQIALYTLAMRSLGAEHVAVSLHTADVPLKEQLQSEQIEKSFELFRSIDRMHRTGVFGLRPGPEKDFGYLPAAPLADIPVPKEILEAKWALVHGAGDWWEGT